MSDSAFPIQLSERMSQLPDYMMEKINKLRQSKRREGVDLIDMSMGNPRDPTPQPIVEQLAEAVQDCREQVGERNVLMFLSGGVDSTVAFTLLTRALGPGRVRGLLIDNAFLRKDEARGILREKFLGADVGITGANLLVAENGAAVVVTNEGNADLTMSLPRVHVVLASIEKLVPTLEDACTILRVLARSATGQEITAYTTFAAGPRAAGDADGPDSFHVVLLDNTRSAMLGGEFHDMLRCIRCAACMNHCPVYGAVGGHAYGWVYPGPMGAVMTPWLLGIDHAADLPNASTLCGRCETVCPMHIALPRLLRRWREKAFGARPAARSALAIRLWAAAAKRPWLYRRLVRLAAGALGRLGRRRGALRRLPFAGGWTVGRDFPAPEGATFYDLWQKGRR